MTLPDARIVEVAKAMAESAGFSWEACAQSQWIRDARAAVLKWLALEPSASMIDKMSDAGGSWESTRDDFVEAYTAMTAQARKEIAGE